MTKEIITVADLIEDIGVKEFTVQFIMHEKSYTREVAEKLYDIWASAGDGYPTILHDMFELSSDNENALRVCSHCGLPMVEGYCINGGEEYYCCDDCLHEHYTEEEYDSLYHEGFGDSYWTEWGIGE